MLAIREHARLTVAIPPTGTSVYTLSLNTRGLKILVSV